MTRWHNGRSSNVPPCVFSQYWNPPTFLSRTLDRVWPNLGKPQASGQTRAWRYAQDFISLRCGCTVECVLTDLRFSKWTSCKEYRTGGAPDWPERGRTRNPAPGVAKQSEIKTLKPQAVRTHPRRTQSNQTNIQGGSPTRLKQPSNEKARRIARLIHFFVRRAQKAIL
jgi:hypothetical protein